jgi:hypothetical protein
MRKVISERENETYTPVLWAVNSLPDVVPECFQILIHERRKTADDWAVRFRLSKFVTFMDVQ